MGDGVLALAIFLSNFLQAAVENPDEQERVYQELLEVLGADRNPEMDDKSKLTYTNAFISEVLRTSETFTILASLECSSKHHCLKNWIINPFTAKACIISGPKDKN